MSYIAILKYKFENDYALNGLCKGKNVALHLLLIKFVFQIILNANGIHLNSLNVDWELTVLLKLSTFYSYLI